MITMPKYKKDILEQLRHVDGIPAILLQMENYIGGLHQHIARAADEIEKLRNEIKTLKEKNK